MLAEERSSLAWTRTGLGALGIGLLLLKLAIREHQPVEFGASGTAFLVAGLSWFGVQRRSRLDRDTMITTVGLVTVLAAATSVLALASVLAG